MIKARGEVLEALEKAEDITKDEYDALVEAVGGAYSRFQNASTREVSDFKKEMKEHWSDIEKSGAAKKIARAARKITIKTPKRKTAKKSGTKKTAAKKSTKKSTRKSTSK